MSKTQEQRAIEAATSKGTTRNPGASYSPKVVSNLAKTGKVGANDYASIRVDQYGRLLGNPLGSQFKADHAVIPQSDIDGVNGHLMTNGSASQDMWANDGGIYKGRK